MEITSFFSGKIIDESIKWILHDVKMQQSELPTLVINQNRQGFHPKVTQTSHPDIDAEVQINESRTRLEGKDPTSRSIFVLQVFIRYPSSVAECVCMCVCLDDTLSYDLKAPGHRAARWWRSEKIQFARSFTARPNLYICLTGVS